jgi:hypothetical protein
MALLGEMHFSPTQLDSTFNLPRAGGVSFAVQESWVLNQTIRDNILFGSSYDEDRYQKGTPLQALPGTFSVVDLRLQYSISVHWSKTLSYLKRVTKPRSGSVV